MQILHPFKAVKGAPRRAVFAFATALALAFGPMPALAQTTSWVDGTGSWFIGTNWSAGVPSSTNPAADISNGGTAIISGVGASAGFLAIASTPNSTGTLNIVNGGTLDITGTSDDVFIGSLSGGTVTVDGTGSQLINGNGNIILPDNGTLTVSNGGFVHTFNLDLADSPDSSVTSTVNVVGSQLVVDSAMSVGRGGNKGTLNITGGGSASMVFLLVAYDLDSVGTANVIGSGPSLSVRSSLFIGAGFNSTGTLTIASGATVTAGGGSGQVTLGFEPGANGTINIGAAPGNPPVAPGTLNASVVQSGSGTGTINFNHTATSYVFAPQITGSISVNAFSGTTILTGPNSYTDGTFFNGGTLSVAADTNLGAATGALTFDGGTLETTAGFSSNRTVTLNSNGGTFQTDTGTLSLTGTISGPGGLTKTGAATLVLSGVNTYSGATTITTGTLKADSLTALSPSSAFVVNGILDLNGFNSTVGSLAGSGIVTNASQTAAILSVGNDNTSTKFSGTITDGASSLALTKVGTGTLTLTGANTYTGGTTIDAGTLQIGNGRTAGSIIGNVTNNGTLAFDHSDAYTFRGTITGTGSVVQTGTGTLTLTGKDTYSGDTVLDSGVLVVDNPSALGTGNMIVNGGVLTTDPQPIDVRGNYFQGPNGTLQLQIAGANPGQYSYLNVTGNATLGGTLKLINQHFQPQAGQFLTLVKTGGVITNTFSHFIDPFTTRPGLNTIELVYNKQSVVLDFLNIVTPSSQSSTINFLSFAQTPNQLAGAQLLDAIELDPRASGLISYFLAHPLPDIPAELDLFSPEALSAFYEISFSNANIQRLMLENRLDALRTSSSPPSLSAGPGGNVGLEKDSGEGKTTKNPVQPVLQPSPQYAFGVWANGFGDFANLDSDFNARGYRFTTGGFDVGVDYRFLDHFAIGVVGSYSHTWTDLHPGTISVNSGRGGLYATYFSGGYYFNGGVYGGYNTYDTSRQALGGNATGNTDGAEWSTFVSTGYDLHYENLTIDPTASLQYTNVYVTDFSETGSVAPLAIHSDSEESLRTDLGFKASYPWQIGSVTVAPYLKAAWEHEFKYSALPVTAGLAEIPGPTATFVGPAEGHDSAVLSTGVSVHWTPRVSTYAEYDGQLGRARYDSNAVTGGVQVSW